MNPSEVKSSPTAWVRDWEKFANNTSDQGEELGCVDHSQESQDFETIPYSFSVLILDGLNFQGMELISKSK
jgi:hypothetical protein